MTGKQFFDWQTSGGTDDVMRLVDCLERADVTSALRASPARDDLAVVGLIQADSGQGGITNIQSRPFLTRPSLEKPATPE
jgi:hypothetical protein